jgi:hypothetical protein
MNPQAEIEHVAPGRARLRIRARKGEYGYFNELATRLEGLDGVTGVTTNPLTGSVLILCDTKATPDAIVAAAQSAGLFKLHKRMAGTPLALADPQAVVAAMDRRLRHATQDEVSLRSAMFILLLGLGLSQMFRGQVMAPATSLLWYAFTILNANGPATGGPGPATPDE